ncbi:hypothetical protein SAMN04487982_110175 [Streptomyces sp. ok210]|jgi:hypothetical protein|nr:hypothetical protein SAMN04487982_110175 [Streptomyces sp. ok210]
MTSTPASLRPTDRRRERVGNYVTFALGKYVTVDTGRTTAPWDLFVKVRID